MGYFAKVNNGIVEKVIVADASYFDTFVDNSPGTWIETDINGISPKNYAGIGHSFDSNRNAFIPPKPFPSWTLNETSCQWKAPTPMPEGANYSWNEATLSWIED